MQVFLEFKATTGSQSAEVTLDAVEGGLPAGWSRDRVREADNLRQQPSFHVAYFRFPQSGDRSGGELLLRITEARVIELQAVSFDGPTPDDVKLRDQYNAVAREFLSTCVRPAIQALGGIVDEEKLDQGPTDWMPVEVAVLLRAFAGNANGKYLGAAEERDWRRFVIAAHMKACKIDFGHVRRWLHEDQGFAEDHAGQLETLYQQCHELLAAHDQALGAVDTVD